MKKYIKILISALIFIFLLVFCLIFIKHNYIYYVKFDETIFISIDQKDYVNEDNIITYDRKKDSIVITMNFDSAKVVYDKTRDEVLIACNNKIMVVKTVDNKTTYENVSSALDFEAVAKYYPLMGYSREINDSMNIALKKVLCSLLAAIIGASLIFVLNPEWLNKKKIRAIGFISIFLASFTGYVLFIIM